MSIDPDHLLEQADDLLERSASGALRQTDLRRAVSTAYYAVFHTILSNLADEFVGAVHSRDPRYRLVYRSLAHERLRRVCREVVKPIPDKAYSPYWPVGGFSNTARGFGASFISLIEARHLADYDPHYSLSLSDALTIVAEARAAIDRLDRMDGAERKLILTLLLCEPRG